MSDKVLFSRLRCRGRLSRTRLQNFTSSGFHGLSELFFSLNCPSLSQKINETKRITFTHAYIPICKLISHILLSLKLIVADMLLHRFRRLSRFDHIYHCSGTHQKCRTFFQILLTSFPQSFQTLMHFSFFLDP